MATAVFTASKNSAYEDLEERWYHFPSTYLAQARNALGDFVVFYEPRRSSGPNSVDGAQAYYAMARVVNIRKDPNNVDHYFADLSEYAEFDFKTPFKLNDRYLESSLQKTDGTTNKGAFGRSIRPLPYAEFAEIVNLGFSRSLIESEVEYASENISIDRWSDPSIEREMITRVVTQRVRGIAFRRHVLDAYGSTCAVTGLRLIDSLGRAEAQAAHILPVAKNGPDSVRNGIAMTASFHWLFDRGMISITNDYTILIADGCAVASAAINIRKQLLLPCIESHRPHPTYLDWHRDQVFSG